MDSVLTFFKNIVNNMMQGHLVQPKARLCLFISCIHFIVLLFIIHYLDKKTTGVWTSEFQADGYVKADVLQKNNIIGDCRFKS